MQQRKFLISLSAIVSGLVLAGSSCSRDADVHHLPAPPPKLAADQTGQPKPVMPETALGSEEIFESWVSDKLDWGDRRDAVAWRWCQLWNDFSKEKTECGAKPAGVE